MVSGNVAEKRSGSKPPQTKTPKEIPQRLPTRLWNKMRGLQTSLANAFGRRATVEPAGLDQQNGLTDIGESSADDGDVLVVGFVLEVILLIMGSTDASMLVKFLEHLCCSGVAEAAVAYKQRKFRDEVCEFVRAFGDQFDSDAAFDLLSVAGTDSTRGTESMQEALRKVRTLSGNLSMFSGQSLVSSSTLTTESRKKEARATPPARQSNAKASTESYARLTVESSAKGTDSRGLPGSARYLSEGSIVSNLPQQVREDRQSKTSEAGNSRIVLPVTSRSLPRSSPRNSPTKARHRGRSPNGSPRPSKRCSIEEHQDEQNAEERSRGVGSVTSSPSSCSGMAKTARTPTSTSLQSNTDKSRLPTPTTTSLHSWSPGSFGLEEDGPDAPDDDASREARESPTKSARRRAGSGPTSPKEQGRAGMPSTSPKEQCRTGMPSTSPKGQGKGVSGSAPPQKSQDELEIVLRQYHTERVRGITRYLDMKRK